MKASDQLLSLVDQHVSASRFRDHHWEGSFEEYLDLVIANTRIARNAFQRLFDMVMHFGFDRYSWLREEFVRYKFFSDPIDGGVDAVFGLDRPLMNLVDFFKSAAHQYGTERRILLLHGPVGSSKSTIARLLKMAAWVTRSVPLALLVSVNSRRRPGQARWHHQCPILRASTLRLSEGFSPKARTHSAATRFRALWPTRWRSSFERRASEFRFW